MPIPAVRFVEEGPTALGSPFFVMDRVDGRVPPDVMPYTLDSWVTSATPEERRVLLEHGTEPAFCGNLLHNAEQGTYACRLCGLPPA